MAPRRGGACGVAAARGARAVEKAAERRRASSAAECRLAARAVAAVAERRAARSAHAHGRRRGGGAIAARRHAAVGGRSGRMAPRRGAVAGECGAAGGALGAAAVGRGERRAPCAPAQDPGGDADASTALLVRRRGRSARCRRAAPSPCSARRGPPRCRASISVLRMPRRLFVSSLQAPYVSSVPAGAGPCAQTNTPPERQESSGSSVVGRSARRQRPFGLGRLFLSFF